MEVDPAGCILATGGVLTVTCVGTETAAQPVPLYTDTPYDPDWVTVIERVVCPFVHVYVLPCEAVSTTDPPAQNVVGPEAITVDTDVPQAG